MNLIVEIIDEFEWNKFNANAWRKLEQQEREFPDNFKKGDSVYIDDVSLFPYKSFSILDPYINQDKTIRKLLENVNRVGTISSVSRERYKRKKGKLEIEKVNLEIRFNDGSVVRLSNRVFLKFAP